MQRRKEHPKQMVLGKCDVHMKKNKSEPTSIHSQWTKDPKAMPEILKLLEENIGSMLQDIATGKDFLNRTLNDPGNQAINESGTPGNSSFCPAGSYC